MVGLYKSEKEKETDVIIANTFKAFSVGVNGALVPASNLEVAIFNEEKAAATARLSIHKVMIEGN